MDVDARTSFRRTTLGRELRYFWFVHQWPDSNNLSWPADSNEGAQGDYRLHEKHSPNLQHQDR